MDLTRRGMGLALAGLRRLAGVEALDRLGLRDAVEQAVRRTARDGARAAGAASRAFLATRDLARPVRQAPTSTPDRFDLTPTDEQRMLQEAFRTFAEKQLRPAAREADDTATTPAELLAGATELGATMLGIPTALGGVVDERSSVTATLALESLAYGDAGLALACMAPGAVSTAIALWGDADQQARYLHPFAGDDAPVAALALLEPRALADPLRPATTGRRDGDDLVLDGVKALVPRAAAAELFLVSADVEGHGPAMVIVASSSQGLTVSPDPAMGLRAAATGKLHLDGVRVPPGAVLAGPAELAEAVQRSWIAWSAVAVGTCQAVLDHVIPYVNERHAFGEPISHRQSVAFAVADMAIELEGMRLATYRAAGRIDRGRPFAREAALARTLATDKGRAIGSDGVQLLGGHGYIREQPVERWYRHLSAIGVQHGALLV